MDLMARKRKLNASLADPTQEPDSTEPPKSNMGGMWAGSAMNMLKQRIEDAHGSLQQGILAGTVALELDPGQIEDALGSDRLTPWQEDEDFAALVANIKRRGQTQPIRVRPKSAEWAPGSDNPLETKDKFLLQSGRRRLEACRALGRKVRAVVSTEQGDKALADLEERFHENTMRRDLNGFEELVSVGLLARSLQELTQTEIAERLGVGQGDVSLGLACLEYRDDILAQVDITTTPKRQYRALLPKLKRGEPVGQEAAPRKATSRSSKSREIAGVLYEAQKQRDGYLVQVKRAQIPEEDLDRLMDEIAQLVQKYAAPE